MNSEEGEAYREQLRKRQLGFWDRQPTVEKTCELCGKTFQTRNVYKPTRFCSKNCTQTNRIREGKENVPFKCGVCGKDFMGNKHKKPKTCSAFCGRLSKSPFRDPDIIPILERAANGEPYPSIASDYNCDGKDISRVVRRRCWKHIPIPKELEERLQRLFQDEHRLGKAHGSLTDDQVRGIKRRVRGGESYSRIAPDFGIGVMLISAIVNGKSYKWVQDDPPALPLS